MQIDWVRVATEHGIPFNDGFADTVTEFALRDLYRSQVPFVRWTWRSVPAGQEREDMKALVGSMERSTCSTSPNHDRAECDGGALPRHALRHGEHGYTRGSGGKRRPRLFPGLEGTVDEVAQGNEPGEARTRSRLHQAAKGVAAKHGHPSSDPRVKGGVHSIAYASVTIARPVLPGPAIAICKGLILLTVRGAEKLTRPPRTTGPESYPSSALASRRTTSPTRGLLSETVVELIKSLSSLPRVDGKQFLKELRPDFFGHWSQAMKGQRKVDEFRGGERCGGSQILELFAPDADETPSDAGDQQGLVGQQRSQALDHQLGMTPGNPVGSSFYLGEQRDGWRIGSEGIDPTEDLACRRPSLGLVTLE